MCDTIKKQCSKCEVFRLVSFFNKSTNNHDGLQSYCKDCAKNYRDSKVSSNGYIKLTPEQWEAKKADTIARRIEKKTRSKKQKLAEYEEEFRAMMKQESIQYKTIPENPNYYCTEDGRVWSRRKGIFLKPSNHVLGYLFIGKFIVKGKKKFCLLHQIVAHTWLDNSKNLPELNHKDANKHNNHYTNLEWTDRKGNMQHAWNSGLMENSRNCDRKYQYNVCYNNKISEQQVREIREMIEVGSKTLQEICELYGLKISTVYKIKTRKSWKWVK